MTGAEIAREPDGAGDIDAARSAEAETFLPPEVENDPNGLGILDLVGLVDLGAFEILGDAALADPLGDRAAFGFQLAVLVVVVERGTHRVGNTDHDVRVVRFETHRHAGKSAAGAYGADEAVDLAVEIAPDLLGGRFDMPLAIGDIVELIGPDRAVRLAAGEVFGKPARIFHVVVRVLVGDGGNLDQLGAGETEHLFFFVGLGLGDDDDSLQPERVADERKADAGISGRSLDHSAARLEL